ncbi:MAG: heat-inducible transcriptional repressor HrcA [Solirubrobacteraceae bacterium]
MLTPRQELILCKVVERYLESGQPVASKTIAADPGLDCAASTVRNELALLEEQDLLAHPHTSAGRVPTDAGHRYVVDRMLDDNSDRSAVAAPPLELSLTRSEVEEAMRATSEALSQVTQLLAVVSAPSLTTATIRHVEVLALQPQVVMLVVITSTGGVSKMLTTFTDPVDPGLVNWAGEYLNERLVGSELGARTLSKRLADPSMGISERAFLERLAPAFSTLASEAQDTLYVDGAAHLLADRRLHDVDQINQLMGLLERRAALLRVLRAALSQSDVYVRIGRENEHPSMRSLALVAAGYGIARRKLGAVSVIGPVHMDYGVAIQVVREAAHELSRFVEHTYAEH